MTRIATALLLLIAGAALAAGPVATPGDVVPQARHEAPPAAGKALGDPTDWYAATLAAGDYLVALQADITEDNAGNGGDGTAEIPDDPDDGGWDWILDTFAHTTNSSAPNIYGSTAIGLLRAYELEPAPARFTALEDAANHIVSEGPTEIRTGSDIVFLCEFAALPGVASPAIYHNAAAAILADRIDNDGGGTATGLAEYLRDIRFNQGYSNGIIPYDVAAYALAAMRLHDVFPAGGYDTAANDIAEVLWQDSFNDNPGYFDPDGANQGYDPAYANSDYWWYTNGVASLIRAFAATGSHTSEIPGLQAILLDCQYPDGAFSYQYGATSAINDRSWQNTSFAAMALYESLPQTPANLAALRNAGTWLASTQDVSTGAFLYSDGNHLPQTGSEAAVAMSYAWLVATPEVSVSVDGPDPVSCGVTKTVTVSYTPDDGSLGLRGYEIVVEFTGGVLLDTTQPGDADNDGFIELDALDDVESTDAQFYVVDNGDDTYTVSGAILGATDGLLTSGDLFAVALGTSASGPVAFDILSVDFRDPNNLPIFPVIDGSLAFTVDCDPPAAVTDIVADPAHEEVHVSWSHDHVDVDQYAIFRGLWYETTPDTSSYPEYDDLAGFAEPTRPASYGDAVASAEWALADTVATGTLTYVDAIAPRGVYEYEVFAIDAADNPSPPAAANDEATNYWLGDFDGDGDVDITDVDVLGDTFGDGDGDASYDNIADVGPTDDASGFGIPTTDSWIQFEDLIIVAMNFGEVSAKALPTVSGSVQLAWTPLEDGRWALELVGGQGLKALRLRADAPLASVAMGELLDDQAGPVFLRNVGDQLDVSVALLGRQAAIEGTGQLLIVESPALLDTDQLAIDARSLANDEMTVEFSQATAVDLPGAFRLDGNFPNPFNPQTTISFALPQAEQVHLAVYDVEGRLVRTLVSGQRPAGVHDVTWNGRDASGRGVASGMYVYRIQAGPHSAVQKMTLMK